ncbi:MAG: 2-hydroxychromene-2-carboxylate isomerase [Rhodospirillales bacterium]|jgi:2-hydroxychromene-2-carboxylate isomerase|nr:2-hydroxychromene-2-carboxylate isomerase [Rhodospirillales bacterium]
MTGTIEFYFDFSSPYGYFASVQIDDLAARFGRTAKWKPIMIGTAFKQSGNRPLLEQPIKGDYSRHDWQRLARLLDVPWVLPEPFPIATLAAARAFWWLTASDVALARRFAQAAFHAYFADGRDISAAGTVAEVAANLDIDAAALLAAVQDPAIKARLKFETDDAIKLGVFGSPFVFVDGEGFWGADRLWMVKRWLESGGW